MKRRLNSIVLLACKNTVCLMCSTVGAHMGHDCKTIKDVVAGERELLEATWEEQASLKDQLQGLASDLNIAEVELSQKRAVVLGEIDEKFEVLRLALEAKKEELKAQVVAHTEERLPSRCGSEAEEGFGLRTEHHCFRGGVFDYEVYIG